MTGTVVTAVNTCYLWKQTRPEPLVMSTNPTYFQLVLQVKEHNVKIAGMKLSYVLLDYYILFHIVIVLRGLLTEQTQDLGHKVKQVLL